MNEARNEKWQRLIEVLEEADELQQDLLGSKHQIASYEFHTQLNNIADELTDFAAAEGCYIG